MSLVSYGASDESDTDDEIVSTNVQTSENAIKVNPLLGHTSSSREDEDDWDAAVGSSTSVTSSSTTTFGKRLTKVSDEKVSPLNSTKATDDNVNSTSITTLEDLPAPQSHIHTAETEEPELEEEVKPKESEIANAPVPPSKKHKQPVKITIPSLDEDHNEEKESKKKAAPSTIKSGLFSLLPAPVHASKKQTNRPLIPQSLTKKSTSATVSTTSITGNKQTAGIVPKRTSEVASTTDVSSKRITPFNALRGYESDSDEDDDKGSTTDFFSLTASSEVKTTENTPEVKRRKLQSEEVSSSESEVNSAISPPKTHEESVDDDENGDGVEEEEVLEEKDTGPEPGAVNDAPLDFNSMNRRSAWSGSSYGFLGPVGLTGPVSQSKSFSAYENSSLPSSSEHNPAGAKVSSEVNDESMESNADDDMKKFMNDKEFQKLHGKRKRGLDGAISFVDANVDDYVDPTEVTKYFTEETDYVSHKNKDNLPTAQQRRKKQITYLAYQAKEREMELKNTWAQNRMTKKQTQSKYGF